MHSIYCLCESSLFIKIIVLTILVCSYIFYLYFRIKDRREKKTLHQSIAEDPSASVNPLTRLPSRWSLLRHLHIVLPSSQVPHALLVIDVDNFNIVNEVIGPSKGDLVIVDIANRLGTLVDKEKEILAHFSADEFAIFMPLSEYDMAECTGKASKILEMFSHTLDFSGYKTQLTVSIGVCIYPNNSTNADDLLQNAVKARYHAKQLGKNTYSCYSQDMQTLTLERTLIAEDLTHALDNNEFIVYYQPKVELSTGKLKGAEALLRWKHKLHGFVAPDVFIPVAEDLGIITSIGNWVLDKVCQDIRRLHSNGFSDITIAVNFSAIQFNQTDLAVIFADTLDKYNLSPSCIEIEITEHTLMTNAQKAKLMLKVLSRMGVAIVVDDFSMGYSSLSYLKDYKIDVLKIDRFFIKNVDKNEDNAVIVKTILSMAHQLGLKVVAEGAESKEEVEFLKTYKCGYIQGFYYSKPLPFVDYLTFLQGKS